MRKDKDSEGESEERYLGYLCFYGWQRGDIDPTPRRDFTAETGIHYGLITGENEKAGWNEVSWTYSRSKLYPSPG